MLSKEVIKDETKKLIEIRNEFYKFLDENIPKNEYGGYDFSKKIMLDAEKVYELFYKLDYQARKLRGFLIKTYDL